MRRAAKALLVVAVVAALGAAGTVFAYAGGWKVPESRGAFSARIAKMPRGVEPSVAEQSGRAVVTWSAQEIAPGVRMDRYVVTAHSDADPQRPGIAQTVTASDGSAESATFTADQVAGGKWRWTVVPHYRRWAGAPSKPSRRLAFPKAPAAPTPAPEPPARSSAPVPAPATSTPPARPPSPAVVESPPEPPPVPSRIPEPPVVESTPEPPAPAESVPAPVGPSTGGPEAG